MIVNSSNIDKHINQLIKDTFSSKDDFKNVDVDVLSEIILAFVKKDKIEQSSDNNRYEINYAIFGNASAIIQGWKQNFIVELEKPSDTKPSIEKYIVETYGD